MRETQRKCLANSNATLHWHNSIKEIPTSASEYTMLIAHEFFDALPVHIFQVRDLHSPFSVANGVSRNRTPATGTKSSSTPQKARQPQTTKHQTRHQNAPSATFYPPSPPPYPPSFPCLHRDSKTCLQAPPSKSPPTRSASRGKWENCWLAVNQLQILGTRL